MELIVIPPLPSVAMMFSLVFANTTFIVFPVPVSLSCSVNRKPLLFLSITFETLFTVVPFSVKLPFVEELPIVNARVLAEVTSIAPIDKEAVPILIPAVVAVPVFANCAMLEVNHAPDAVLGDQLAAVYQAVDAPVLAQVI